MNQETIKLNPNQTSPDLGEVLLIDKPLTWTSFDVVKKLKFAGRFKKIGHAGTLDPLATGLLILCTGKMTKQIDSFQAQQKEYSGTFVLGKTTPSIDLETEFDEEFPIDHINEVVLQEALSKFQGKILQIPPIYSAIQVNGKRLYELARKGKTDADIEIKSREVEISKFEIDSSNFPEIQFSIVCSKGTYIRSLVRDFGLACQSGAYLSSLRREKIGEFDVKDALTIQEFIEQRKVD
ncbi:MULTISPECIES: tRNA pseudouridine(55) synthase TruB [unclassified Arcicella]|uniref:tRNA pseudouridine(55) synthase TruB n=1 Tax=unclassified Arcicella TaxID=2644986 RepID=UPI0028617A5E|nr:MULTISPECIES: tRNA pseudouridine(55) synthase TruB [unclassified Arcicella]MDR6562655.1 tRNA pseudouridine55 synthase [Arcicella sp. BE51]MDR6812742.1 tRNA pseudouridine55 synthase [Arcicella sp. BE140]MDR6824054.1 tRNA pseudouridine55 synthase [Arcicella sp. BE139]